MKKLLIKLEANIERYRTLLNGVYLSNDISDKNLTRFYINKIEYLSKLYKRIDDLIKQGYVINEN